MSPGSASGAGGIELTFTENAVVYAINDTRVEHGVPPLRINDDLVRAARFHSKDMVERQYFEHGPFGERLKRFGFKTGTVGENLGWLNNHKLAAPRLIQDVAAKPIPSRGPSPPSASGSLEWGSGLARSWAGTARSS